MSHIENVVSSTIPFEIEGPSTRSKMLHQIASDIQGDGLKIKRITILEKPLLARVYIKDMTFKPIKRKRFLKVLRPDTNSDIYDYVVCLSIQELPLFKRACSYTIERCNYLNDIKTSAKRHFSNKGKHITHSVSDSIQKSLTCVGAEIGHL